MNTNVQIAGGPPKFLASLISGFNLVAGKAYLLLLPVALDLLLWFGPHFRFKTMLTPVINDLFSLSMPAASETALFNNLHQAWGVILEHFNLLSLLSGSPIGVPSLMSGLLPITDPFGAPPIYEVDSVIQGLAGLLLFSILGLALGAFFFNLVARASFSPGESFSFSRFVWQTGQIFLMTLLLIALILLSLPLFLFAALLSLISPVIAQVALIALSFILLWLLIPLIFTPHGIFIAGQNAVRSMVISLRLVRALFPGVGLFLLSALILSQGLGYLWRIPPDDSWLMLAGIFGNAFISTGLLAASFYYYRGAAVWAAQSRK